MKCVVHSIEAKVERNVAQLKMLVDQQHFLFEVLCQKASQVNCERRGADSTLRTEE